MEVWEEACQASAIEQGDTSSDEDITHAAIVADVAEDSDDGNSIAYV